MEHDDAHPDISRMWNNGKKIKKNRYKLKSLILGESIWQICTTNNCM